MFLFNSRIWSNRFPSTLAFEKASGVYTPVEIKALQYLEFAFKQTGLWSKMHAIYPFVGGTALSHSINLKNPNEYKITWGGVVTHNSNGITGNASSGYGDSGYIINPTNDRNNFSVGIYVRNDLGNVSQAAYGAVNASPFEFCHLYPRDSVNACYCGVNQNINDSFSNSDAKGYYTQSRGSSSSHIVYKRSSLAVSSSTASSIPPIYSLAVLARRGSAGFINFSAYNVAFWDFAQSLNSTEILTKYSIVQQFQTMLGRQI